MQGDARSVTQAMRPIAWPTRLVSVGEHEDLIVMDNVYEPVRELADMPSPNHRFASPSEIRRRRIRPLEDQIGGGVSCVRELPTETAIPNVSVFFQSVEVLRACLRMLAPV